MNDIEPQVIVSKEWSTVRLIVLMILFFGVGAGVLAVLTFRDVRGKAAAPASPVPVASASMLPSPNAELSVPYVRLVSYKKSYAYRTNVPIDVYLHTNGEPTSELFLVISYDPGNLEITKDDIVLDPYYKSADVQIEEEGKMTISLFVNPELDHQPVATDTEIKVASLRFKTRSLTTQQSDITLEFEKNDTATTSLSRFSKERTEAENILENVEGTSFSIIP